MGNSHASAVVGEKERQRSSMAVMLKFCPWPAMVHDQRLTFTVFRSVSISTSLWEIPTKVQIRSIGKLHWYCHGKILQIVQMQRDWWTQIMERALCESVGSPGFEFGLSAHSLLCLVQLLKCLYIISAIYWPVFIDWFFYWSWENIFLLLYMSSNFLLDNRHCEAVSLSIWTMLSSFKECQNCFGRQLMYSRNSLIPLSPVFKPCYGGLRVAFTQE